MRNWSSLWDLQECQYNQIKDAAIDLYKKLKALKNPEFIFDEYQLNDLGHELRREKKIADAVKIFELNREEYPTSPIVYESLGELYKRNHNRKKALPYFEKAQQLEPQNLHWSFMINKLKIQ